MLRPVNTRGDGDSGGDPPRYDDEALYSLKREAMGIAVQLPRDSKDALMVLELARLLVVGFLSVSPVEMDEPTTGSRSPPPLRTV